MKSKNKQMSEAAGINGTASEVVYPLEELAEHSVALLGVNREVLLGAVHGASRNHFSVEEARQRVQQFLKRKVQ
ncbi:hypothetical protein J25TS5_49120 [Paenibacillus faecis]|uniref:hypothetical protein n=1 Tax=Paenibacillus faecis TaxID=862114 RepID=UPI001B1DC204|nr:hypothetical protein [Paenibacillus faecis]GIO87980.1 hypothetical protein J25TS5_49120 [Paenibacillus faecis]